MDLTAHTGRKYWICSIPESPLVDTEMVGGIKEKETPSLLHSPFSTVPLVMVVVIHYFTKTKSHCGILCEYNVYHVWKS